MLGGGGVFGINLVYLLIWSNLMIGFGKNTRRLKFVIVQFMHSFCVFFYFYFFWFVYLVVVDRSVAL